MISHSKIKYYSSLLQKKFRDEEKKFIAEGIKTVKEGLNSSYKCEILFVRKGIEEKEPILLENLNGYNIEIEFLSEKEFSRISDSKTPQGISAVFQIKKETDFYPNKTSVCMDNISDPGNAGTIIRNCDWFGIDTILIGNNCADIYSPKVIRSSMGSLFHEHYIFADNLAEKLLQTKKRGFKIVTADMNGTNLLDYKFEKKSILIFSNEAHGVSQEIRQLSDDIITIPGSGKAESLNVASASAVILSRYAEKFL